MAKKYCQCGGELKLVATEGDVEYYACENCGKEYFNFLAEDWEETPWI
jgi:hypothetical protein